jgi:hypothetical protein
VERLVAINSDPNLQDLFVIPGRFVVEDKGFIGYSMMIVRICRGQSPFNVSCAANERDIVEVDDLITEIVSVG